tara:strand:- start:570 stop:722 length:153 start_codon:yes stop_codon:yes gene_type:complete
VTGFVLLFSTLMAYRCYVATQNGRGAFVALPFAISLSLMFACLYSIAAGV